MDTGTSGSGAAPPSSSPMRLCSSSLTSSSSATRDRSFASSSAAAELPIDCDVADVDAVRAELAAEPDASRVELECDDTVRESSSSSSIRPVAFVAFRVTDLPRDEKCGGEAASLGTGGGDMFPRSDADEPADSGREGLTTSLERTSDVGCDRGIGIGG